MAVVVQKKSEDAKRPAKVDPKSKMKLKDNVVSMIEKKKKNDDTKR